MSNNILLFKNIDLRLKDEEKRRFFPSKRCDLDVKGDRL